VAQRVGRDIALIFHDRGTRRGGEWSAARPGCTLPTEKTRYPIYRMLGGSQGRSGQVENLVPTGIRSRTVQPVTQSLYRLSYRAHTHTRARTRTHAHTHTYTHTHTHIYRERYISKFHRWYGDEAGRFELSFPTDTEIFLFSSMSSPSHGPTKLSI